MTRRRGFCLPAAVVVSLLGCTTSPPTSTPTYTATPLLMETPALSDLAIPTAMASDTIAAAPTPTDTATPTSQPTPVAVSVNYQMAFGIDYARPEEYLAQGEQTQVSNPAVLDPLRTQEQSMAHLGDIYRWLQREFTYNSVGGGTIGVVTVDQLLAEHQLGGCHDCALVYAAVVRHLGYPAVMADSYSIAWVEQFQAGAKGQYIGHVFVEVYLGGKWVLVDPTNGWYVESGYDPADPVIPLRGAIAGSSKEIYGFHGDRKGSDTWAYGITSVSKLTQAMDELARRLDLEAIAYPEYVFEHFTG